jgi:molybdopterin converting factor small subunit
MQIRVTYFGQVRAAAGVSAETLALPAGSTVLDALRALPGGTRPQLQAFLFDPHGEAAAALLVMLNERPVPRSELATAVLNEDDELTLVPPIAGG